MSVVRPGGGSARLELDPERLPAPGGAGFLRLEPRDGPAGQFAALTRDVFARVDAYFERRARASAAGATVAEMRRIYETYDPSPDADAVARRLAVVEDPGLRAWMMAAYLAAPIRTDSLLARRALRDISPASPAWGLDPRALPEALSASGTPETARVYAGSVEAEHPDPAVRASALAFLLEDALAADREADLADLYDRLIRSYPDSKPAAKARELYAPDRRIQPGRRVPAFSVTTMDDPPLLVSNESLRGKVVLMDFWATWCGPCITEMPYLHRAFEKYGPAGFTILSVSFDLAPEDVTRYRTEGDWTMPWLHAWVDLGTDSELAKRMDIVNIPRAILFDAEGRILATNEDLRGRRLDETLSRALAGETEP